MMYLAQKRMGKIRTITLSEAQRVELLHGYKNGSKHAFRKRCHLVLLKSEERSSQDVSRIIDMHQVTVNNWLTRYESEGIAGLKTKPGRGRKSILNPVADAAKVRQIVKEERQRLGRAKDILEKELNKTFSRKTLKRFLKNLSADTSASG